MKNVRQFVLSQLKLSEDHQLVSWLFLKMLAIIYFSAFLSMAVQISGLVGSNGILPFNDLLTRAFYHNGFWAFFYLPNLFWINSSDIALQVIAYSGCVVSVLLFIGFQQKISLIILFVFYLSIFHAGQTFLTFQWDSLLLETGFIAIFLAAGPSHLVIFLYHWLLFRLRFMSGFSKLASGDVSWANLSTLNYYFETQPLPHVGAWYFHQFPDLILKAGVVLVFISELIVPFFIFLPRRFRIVAAAITIFIQLLIIATSNHNWINLLTIILCLFLLDDKIIRTYLPERFQSIELSQYKNQKKNIYLLPVVTVLIVVTSVSAFFEMNFQKKLPDFIAQSNMIIRSWGIGHIFHVFPTMQTERHEFQIEGSYDGREWKSYQFKYKPGPLEQRPKFIVPHQPRLDWLIWFVPPQHPEFVDWFNRFIMKLKEGSPEVLSLLEENPFNEMPPRFIRVQVFQYEFTTAEERRETGQWWKYKYLGLFPFVEPRRP